MLAAEKVVVGGKIAPSRAVLSSGLYAIPALAGAALVVVADSGGVDHVLGAPVALCAAGVCFLIRVAGLRFGIDAPRPPATE